MGGELILTIGKVVGALLVLVIIGLFIRSFIRK